MRHTVEVAIESVWNPIVVVLGAYADQIQLELDSLAVQTLVNSQWAEGMETSIQAGISALMAEQPQLKAVVITLCDQPFISAKLINQLVKAHHLTGKPIAASAYAETLGTSALFDRALFTQLLRVEAAIGAKLIMKQSAQEICCVPFTEGAIDIDTPADYQWLLK